MKRVLAGSLGLTLGFFTTTSRADDLQWRAVGAARYPAPAAVAATPVAETVWRPAVELVDRQERAGEFAVWTVRPSTSVAAIPANDRHQPVGFLQAATHDFHAVAQHVTVAPGTVAPGAVAQGRVVPGMMSSAAAAEPWRPVRYRGQDADKSEKLHSPKSVTMPPGAAHVPGLTGPGPVHVPGLTGPGTHNACGPGAEFMPSTTFNLVGEHCCGEQPAPVDPGVRTWARGEYLMWWARPMPIPPLATTSLMPSINDRHFGFLGDPFTRVLIGNQAILGGMRHGGRFTLGMWFNECQRAGVDASYFFLGRAEERFVVSPDQFPTITRPIFSPNLNAGVQLGEFGELVTFPGVSRGTLTITAGTELWGVDINGREALWCRKGCNWGSRAELFAGFRYLDLLENINIFENPVTLIDSRDVINGRVVITPAGTQRIVDERFHTHNQFYGGQMGVDFEWRRNRWAVTGRAAVALGLNHETLLINGTTTQLVPGQAPAVFQGGLLTAAGTNIGRFDRDVFSVVPEARLNLNYQLTRGIRAFVGYNFMYWSNVIRPGDQIDRVVDVARLPIAPVDANGVPIPATDQLRPAVLFRANDYWAQGLNFGMEVRW